MEDKSTVKAVPKIATHKLGITERMLGERIEVEVSSDTVNDQSMVDLAAESFWQLYKANPEPLPNVPRSRDINARLFDWMKSSPGFEKNRASTVGSIAASRVASGLMYRHLSSEESIKDALDKQKEADDLERQRQEQQAIANALRQAGREQEASTHEQNAQQLMEQIEQAMNEAHQAIEGLEQDVVSTASLNAAMQESAQAAEEVAESMKSWGLGRGDSVHYDPNSLREFEKLNSDRLQRIAKLAGRVHGIGSQSRINRVVEGTTPTTLEFTKDPSLLLAEELARISPNTPDAIRLTAMVEFAQNGLMGWKLSGEAKERGPFVFLGDRSGSMYGTDMEVMLGVGLGLARIARDDGRRYILGTFNHRGGGIVTVTSEDDWKAHMTWATQTASGGTDFDAALEFAMETIEGMNESVDGTDLVFTTDGWCSVSHKNFEWWQNFSEETGSRLLYVPVNAQAATNAGRMGELADKILPIGGFTNDEADNLAEQIGSWI